MALGTATVVAIHRESNSPTIRAELTFAGDDSYPTGGTTEFEDYVKSAIEDNDDRRGSLGDLRLESVLQMDEHLDRLVRYSRTVDKFFVIVPGTTAANAAQLAASTDDSGNTYRVMCTLS